MEPLFRHLLVPVEFGEKSRAALDYAGRLAAIGECRVTLLHVIEALELEAGDELEVFYARLAETAAEQLSELARVFEAVGVVVSQKTTVGRPAAEIVRCAVEEEIDLVVLGSHRIDLDQPPRGWGTISYQVSVLCPCPVLLVK